MSIEGGQNEILVIASLSNSSKLEFEAVPVNAVPDLPASCVLMHFPCPWC